MYRFVYVDTDRYPDRIWRIGLLKYEDVYPCVYEYNYRHQEPNHLQFVNRVLNRRGININLALLEMIEYEMTSCGINPIESFENRLWSALNRLSVTVIYVHTGAGFRSEPEQTKEIIEVFLRVHKQIPNLRIIFECGRTFAAVTLKLQFLQTDLHFGTYGRIYFEDETVERILNNTSSNEVVETLVDRILHDSLFDPTGVDLGPIVWVPQVTRSYLIGMDGEYIEWDKIYQNLWKRLGEMKP